MFKLSHEKALRALVFLAASAIVGALLYYGTPVFAILEDLPPAGGTWIAPLIALADLAAISLIVTAGVLAAALLLHDKLPRVPRSASLGIGAGLLFVSLLLPGLYH
jgi:hypothetical protein